MGDPPNAIAIQAASSISSCEKPISRAFLMWIFAHGSHLARIDNATASAALETAVEDVRAAIDEMRAGLQDIHHYE